MSRNEEFAMTRRTVLGGLAATGLAGAPALATVAERPTRIRHYVLATHDMNFVCDQIYEVLGLAPLRRDGPSPTEAYGFHSTMMKIGTTMLEVVQPMRPDHHLNRWFDERGGDGGYMVVMQTFNSDALKTRAAAEGLTLTRDMIFRGQHMLQFDYRHFGTHFELYQYTPAEDWWGDPNGRPYPEARVATEIVGADVAVEDPQAIAAQAARLFGAGSHDGTRLGFEDRRLNFVPSRGNWRGLVALDLRARDQSRVGDWARIGGVTFRFV